MTMDHWKISRAGVLNFWYYDEEYFQFESGRLLFRGSNGSGKSVTMQSLVPLLFDGNKSPERLDPFGSKARKMENYLLSDGLDLEERTAYLFLEFEKSSVHKHITIGMGMRARKNMPLQSWYFIILDGRRIGPGLDFTLYKDLGSKVPLTAKELENRIGAGGKFFTSQKEYRLAVNEHLFGFNDVEEFEELIELLIQLRSPKLSKEFKPTTMYEIMQNSLQTLTDEDLRPMSESIESMDEIKTKIEQLERSKLSLGRIGSVYDKYNAYQLAFKAQHWLKGHEHQQQIVSELAGQEQKLEKEQTLLTTYNEAIEALSVEEEALQTKSTSLKAHDFSRLIEEKHQLENRLKYGNEKLIDKENQLSKQKTFERQRFSEIQKKETSLETLKDALGLELENLGEHSDVAQFDEHLFFVSEFKNQMETGFSFQYLDTQCAQHTGALKKGQTLLGEQELLERKHEGVLAELSDVRYQKERQERKLSETQQQLTSIKDEYVEKLFHWHGELADITLARAVMSQSAERVQAYGTSYYFDDLIAPVRGAMNEAIGVVREQSNVLKIRQNTLDGELKQNKKMLENMKSMKDLEPLREAKVIKNRERLSALNIPFVPLYMAIDFREDVPEALRGHLEEALLDMGLLDALIIPPEYEAKVREHDLGMADKYLFASPELFSFNVSEYLTVESAQTGISAQLIDDVLKSLFLDSSAEKAYITEKGAYGMGILKGYTSREHVPIFVGYQSRKRHKENQMALLEAGIYELSVQIRALQTEIDVFENQMTNAYQALEAFPKTIDLDLAYREVGRESTELGRIESLVAAKSQQAEQLYELLKIKRLEVQQAVSKLSLTPSKVAFDEAVDAMVAYGACLNQLKLCYKDYRNTRESIASLQNQYEETLEFIETFSADVFTLQKEREHYQSRLSQIQSQVQMEDFKAIQAELEYCLKRLGDIPAERNHNMEARAHSLASINGASLKRKDLEHEKNLSSVKMDLFNQVLDAELALEYVMPYEKGETPEHRLKWVGTILKAHSGILEEKKQIQGLRDDLQERLLKETGELAEYNLKRKELFGEFFEWVQARREGPSFEVVDDAFLDDLSEKALEMQRFDIVGRVSGKEVKFYELSTMVQELIQVQSMLLNEQDRELFEEILIKSVSRKISARIWHSERWVEKINELMESMNTSSGLMFHLKWATKKAEREDQLGTEELVSLLKMDQGLLTAEHRERLIKHFRSKIQESRIRATEMTELSSFLTLMKEILDYRKWFEFKLYFTKKGDKRKEMTNNAFFTFSGGEKAMAMYVPLFSAVYAKYSAGAIDCPRIISLDEAFAGVDEKNIRDMFRLLIELDLSFVANSQVLYGDYDTVPALAICELIRPENVTFVTVLKYKWNGFVRQLIEDEV